VLSAARQLAGKKATPAIELVGYDQDVEAAMKYVFGGAFICQVGHRASGCLFLYV
jgi:structural maintenance of chromosome 2